MTSADLPGTLTSQQSGPFAGIRVVEFANYVSGPYAGMLLGDMGADVIKVEEPTKGDPFRGWGRVEYSPTFGSVNRNKKSVTLDLKSEQGKAGRRGRGVATPTCSAASGDRGEGGKGIHSTSTAA